MRANHIPVHIYPTV